MSLAVAVAAACLASTGAASPSRAVTAPTAETAAAALQRAAEQCGSGEVCFWRDRNYSGTPWRWSPSNGYRDLPSNLHDHVYSFYANARACFIDWSPEERRAVNSGDYAKAYDTNFGKRIDAVDVRC
ncbi:peptidase inhibitor family I36 protein [Kitasatospora sp. NPDC004289]